MQQLIQMTLKPQYPTRMDTALPVPFNCAALLNLGRNRRSRNLNLDRIFFVSGRREPKLRIVANTESSLRLIFHLRGAVPIAPFAMGTCFLHYNFTAVIKRPANGALL
jgi:hypothetical protein